MAMQTARETRERRRIGVIVLEASPETPSRVVMNVCPFFCRRLLLRALCLVCNYGSEEEDKREHGTRGEGDERCRRAREIREGR